VNDTNSHGFGTIYSLINDLFSSFNKSPSMPSSGKSEVIWPYKVATCPNATQ
jgi:hypothetical protein